MSYFYWYSQKVLYQDSGSFNQLNLTQNNSTVRYYYSIKFIEHVPVCSKFCETGCCSITDRMCNEEHSSANIEQENNLLTEVWKMVCCYLD